jgi:hypothetical protein
MVGTRRQRRAQVEPICVIACDEMGWDGLGERRRAEARTTSGMQNRTGRELRQGARRQANAQQDRLTMEPETTIRSRPNARRGESRTVYASTFAAGRRKGGARAAQSDTRGASRGQMNSSRGDDGASVQSGTGRRLVAEK